MAIDRKIGRHPRDSEGHLGLFGCVGVYLVAMLRLFGCKCYVLFLFNMKFVARPSAATKPWHAKDPARNGSLGLFEES